MLRAYDKATGKEVGAVYMPAPQSGSPMTYMLNGKQYIVVAISGASYSGRTGRVQAAEFVVAAVSLGATVRKCVRPQCAFLEQEIHMIRKLIFTVAILATPALMLAQAKLLRHPSYSKGKIAFSYLGDIWIANENGSGVAAAYRQQGAGSLSALLARRQLDRILLQSRRQLRRVRDPGRRRQAASSSRFIAPTTTWSAGRPTARR